MLQNNAVSHRLGACLESALAFMMFLTHCGMDETGAISPVTFSNAFS